MNNTTNYGYQYSDEQVFFAGETSDVKIPSKRFEDGGYDIYPFFEEDCMVIMPHETVMIPTGLYSAFSPKYVALLQERGSTGTKGVGQRAGVIDSGYRSAWMVPITNHNEVPLVIRKDKVAWADAIPGDAIIYPYEKAICQAVFVEVPVMDIQTISKEELQAIPSERGEGKLGSSGK